MHALETLLFSLTAGEKLSGIHQQPNNTQEMKDNVEQVLQFMASKKIRMHQTTAKGRRSSVKFSSAFLIVGH